MTDICYLRSSVTRYRGLSRYLRRSALRVQSSLCRRIWLSPRAQQSNRRNRQIRIGDYVVDQRPHTPAAVDLLSGYPIVAPGSGDSVRWRRCRVQRSGERSGSTIAPPQFFPDTPKLCRGRRVAMSNGLREFWYFPTANMRNVLCARRWASPRRPVSASCFCCPGRDFSA